MRRIVPVLVGLLGCGTMPPSGAPADDAAVLVDVALANTTTDQPATAPEADLEPDTYARVRAIFERSCSGYCHAGGGDVGPSLILAPSDGSAPTLLDRPSRQVPRVMLVVPGDPDASYLVRKIDGTMGALPECASNSRRCGIPMPYAVRDGGPVVVMPAEERDLIRRWIAAGAPGLDRP